MLVVATGLLAASGLVFVPGAIDSGLCRLLLVDELVALLQRGLDVRLAIGEAIAGCRLRFGGAVHALVGEFLCLAQLRLLVRLFRAHALQAVNGLFLILGLLAQIGTALQHVFSGVLARGIRHGLAGVSAPVRGAGEIIQLLLGGIKILLCLVQLGLRSPGAVFRLDGLRTGVLEVHERLVDGLAVLADLAFDAGDLVFDPGERAGDITNGCRAAVQLGRQFTDDCRGIRFFRYGGCGRCDDGQRRRACNSRQGRLHEPAAPFGSARAFEQSGGHETSPSATHQHACTADWTSRTHAPASAHGKRVLRGRSTNTASREVNNQVCTLVVRMGA